MGETPTLLELHRRQQSVPHSGLREALLAPMVAPALPDMVRSSSLRLRREWKEEKPRDLRGPADLKMVGLTRRGPPTYRHRREW